LSATRVSLNFARAHSNMSQVDVRDRRNMPRSTSTALLCNMSEGCSTAVGAEHCSAAQSQLHELERHDAVVDVADSIPLNSSMSISMRRVVRLSSSDFDEFPPAT